MMGPLDDPRGYLEALAAEIDPQKDGTTDAWTRISSPKVGLWRNAPHVGTLLRSGDPIGEIETLGVLRSLHLPAGAHGVVVGPDTPAHARLARLPVDYGAQLLLLDPEATSALTPGLGTATGQPGAQGVGLVFRAPTSGRYYARPAPDKPPFVEEGDEISVGQTLGLLEVMKTFTRIQFGGYGLPERAKVVRVVAKDLADLEVGEAILELDPIP